MSEQLENAKRLVIKIGSALLVDEASGLRRDWLQALVEDIVRLRQRGQEVVIVSSGAVALGAIPGRPDDDVAAAREAAHRAAALNVIAGQNFNRGVRLFLFAIPVLFWVVGAWAFLIALALLTLVMLRRQFLTVAELDGLGLAWKVQEEHTRP